MSRPVVATHSDEVRLYMQVDRYAKAWIKDQKNVVNRLRFERSLKRLIQFRMARAGYSRTSMVSELAFVAGYIRGLAQRSLHDFNEACRHGDIVLVNVERRLNGQSCVSDTHSDASNSPTPEQSPLHKALATPHGVAESVVALVTI